MGLLADIYLSRDDAEAVRYDEEPATFADRIQFRGFTTLELSTLWALMRDVEWDVKSLDRFPCVLQLDGGGRSIYRIPKDMLEDLARLTPKEMSVVSGKWAATDELACEPSDVRPIIEGLASLAVRASKTGRNIYFWNCV
jgi:hypothetical protein